MAKSRDFARHARYSAVERASERRKREIKQQSTLVPQIAIKRANARDKGHKNGGREEARLGKQRR